MGNFCQYLEGPQYKEIILYSGPFGANWSSVFDKLNHPRGAFSWCLRTSVLYIGLYLPQIKSKSNEKDNSDNYSSPRKFSGCGIYDSAVGQVALLRPFSECIHYHSIKNSKHDYRD